MKQSKLFLTALTILSLLAGSVIGFAAEEKSEGKSKAKPYPLKTCIVSDEKLGGDHGEPYVFTHEGQEIKLCCKPCQKDFKKDPAKYMKKIQDAEKKAKKS